MLEGPLSIFRKILLAFVCIVVAGVSTWLRYGNVEAARQWLSSRPPPRVEASVPAASQEEVLPFHAAYAGTNAASRDSVMVLHFRRPDSPDETMAKVAVKVLDADGVVRKEVSVWGAFRHDASLGASIARFTIGTFPPGTYSIAADIGSRQALGVRRAAIEFAAMDAEPVWADLAKAN